MNPVPDPTQLVLTGQLTAVLLLAVPLAVMAYCLTAAKAISRRAG